MSMLVTIPLRLLFEVVASRSTPQALKYRQSLQQMAVIHIAVKLSNESAFIRWNFHSLLELSLHPEYPQTIEKKSGESGLKGRGTYCIIPAMTTTIQLNAQVVPWHLLKLLCTLSPATATQKTTSRRLMMKYAFSDAHFLNRCTCSVRSW